MTDPISSYTRMGRMDSGRNQAADRSREPDTSSAGTGAAATGSPRQDELVLSDAARRLISGEPFDRSKVESIKEAIRNGQYPIDTRRIAESFFAIESMISE